MDVSTMVIVAVLAVLYLIFLLWYGGRGKPLAPDEVEDLLRQMRRRAGRDDSTARRRTGHAAAFPRPGRQRRRP